jgi:hypothetical protein
MPKPSLASSDLKPIERLLKSANTEVAAKCPGERGDRQPVHVVYGGAHLFKSDTAKTLASGALAAMETYAPNAEALARAHGLDRATGAAI